MLPANEMQRWKILVTYYGFIMEIHLYIDGLVQERRNSSALALELHLSCIKPVIFSSSQPDDRLRGGSDVRQ